MNTMNKNQSEFTLRLVGGADDAAPAQHEEAAPQTSEQRGLFIGALQALMASLDAKDAYTHGHCERVSVLAKIIASGLKLTFDEIKQVALAGLVHDIGKIGVPENILKKPSRLTDEEFAVIKQHPDIGCVIINAIPSLRDLAPGVKYHHERWDARGYPYGLSGGEIPLFARILAVADSFDAMRSTRTYSHARAHVQVVDEMMKCRGSQFDPQIAETLAKADLSEYDAMLDEHRSLAA